jgi:sialic acid synthase SpsE
VNVTASRRGLYTTRSLRAGDRVARTDVIALRPATRVTPLDLDALVGTTLARDIEAGGSFEPQDLEAASATRQTEGTTA